MKLNSILLIIIVLSSFFPEISWDYFSLRAVLQISSVWEKSSIIFHACSCNWYVCYLFYFHFLLFTLSSGLSFTKISVMTCLLLTRNFTNFTRENQNVMNDVMTSYWYTHRSKPVASILQPATWSSDATGFDPCVYLNPISDVIKNWAWVMGRGGWVDCTSY